MSNSQTLTAEPTTEPKKRRRRASNYMVLRRSKPGGTGDQFSLEASEPSAKECIQQIIAGRIQGELLIVCVRRRLTSVVEETVTLT